MPSSGAVSQRFNTQYGIVLLFNRPKRASKKADKLGFESRRVLLSETTVERPCALTRIIEGSCKERGMAVRSSRGFTVAPEPTQLDTRSPRKELKRSEVGIAETAWAQNQLVEIKPRKGAVLSEVPFETEATIPCWRMTHAA